MRDTVSKNEAFNSLIDRYCLELEHFKSILDSLEAEYEKVTADAENKKDVLENFKNKIVEGRERVKEWKIDTKGFSIVLRGLKDIYKSGCKSMNLAYKTGSEEMFHNWRKDVKYHRFHMILLNPILSNKLKKEIFFLMNYPKY